MADRAILFIDGNNWYHGLAACGVLDPMRLSYAKVSEKLVGPRDWVGTRYYIGALKQDWNRTDYANQRRFLSGIEADDKRVTVHLGRLERRPMKNPLADELTSYLLTPEGLTLPTGPRGTLSMMAYQHQKVTTLKEKAVDVMLAIDILRLAIENKYEAAYLLSADGDFTPPVEAVCAMGKKVYGASPNSIHSSALRTVCTSYISLKPDWFSDCYR
jgi:uncharacterized LabA/DUF88 family protein